MQRGASRTVLKEPRRALGSQRVGTFSPLISASQVAPSLPPHQAVVAAVTVVPTSHSAAPHFNSQPSLSSRALSQCWHRFPHRGRQSPATAAGHSLPHYSPTLHHSLRLYSLILHHRLGGNVPALFSSARLTTHLMRPMLRLARAQHKHSPVSRPEPDSAPEPSDSSSDDDDDDSSSAVDGHDDCDGDELGIGHADIPWPAGRASRSRNAQRRLEEALRGAEPESDSDPIKREDDDDGDQQMAALSVHDTRTAAQPQPRHRRAIC
jgi:hypothetical protein